jgi:hypothetical protein
MEDWIYIREHQPKPDDPSAHEIEWVDGDDDEHHIVFVDDRMAGTQFFAFWSPTKAAHIEEQLLDGPFDVMRESEVWEIFRAAHTEDEIIAAFGKLAVIAPPTFDPRFEAPVCQVLEHPSARVRGAALGMLTYMQWPQWRQQVEAMCAGPDPEVARKACIVIEGYEKLVDQTS